MPRLPHRRWPVHCAHAIPCRPACRPDHRGQFCRRAQRVRHRGYAGIAGAHQISGAASATRCALRLVGHRRCPRAVCRGILRRQNSRPRSRLERAAHFHSRAGCRADGLSGDSVPFAGRAACRYAHGRRIALIAHGGKTAAHAAIAPSPEPFSNIVLSMGGDALSVFLTWMATWKPYVAAGITPCWS